MFNKAGRFISQNFKFNNISINCVQQYKYLGIYFTASGSFAYAQNKKALKAYFKFQKDFLNQNPNVDVTIHLTLLNRLYGVWQCDLFIWYFRFQNIAIESNLYRFLVEFQDFISQKVVKNVIEPHSTRQTL